MSTQNQNSQLLERPKTPLSDSEPPHGEIDYGVELGSLDFDGLISKAHELQEFGNYKNTKEFYEMAAFISTKDQTSPIIDYEHLTTNALELEDVGNYRAAYGFYGMANYMLDENEYNKVGEVNYKMAETLHKIADSGIYNRDTSLAKLDEAEELLKTSNENYKKAQEKEMAEILKESRKHSFRLGARAVMNTFKSTIRSTLNRHN
jgi:hypothetical protein